MQATFRVVVRAESDRYPPGGEPARSAKLKVAVVGGGISGLSAAWALRDGAEVTVIEARSLGGRIRTEAFEGRPVDTGPDAFLTRTPAAVELCRQLGVDDLVAPAAGSTLLWHRGRLRRLPEGLVLGVPKQLSPVVRSGLLGPIGLLRAAADLVLPRRPLDADPSVRDLVAARFGAQVADRLVDPLVGGIHAGRIADLSARSTVPQLVDAQLKSRSLLLGLRSSPAPTAAGPMFLTPRGGLTQMVEALVDQLRGAGTAFVTAEVTGLYPDGPAWRIEPGGDRFDGVVLACDHAMVRHLLAPEPPAALAEMESASVVLATLGYSDLETPDGMNGILVPAPAGWLMTACSFASSKWPHWAAPGRTVLRVSSGRAGDNRATEMDDDELVDRLATEVGAALGTSARPDTWRVSRWPASFPQYRVGHGARVSAIEDELRRTRRGVVVCGSSFHGVGIPACIASASRAAATLRETLTSTG